MHYIAHIDEKGKIQTVKQHSEGTAKLANDFAVSCFKDVCQQIGLLHDVGKYQHSFQRRIRNEDIAVEHSICGAQIAYCKYPQSPVGLLMALCIAGHHGGIPDCGVKGDSESSATLRGRLMRKCEDYSYYQKDLKLEDLEPESLNALLMENCHSPGELTERFAFFVRYCFSCLVDADTLNTMESMGTPPPPPLTADFAKCLEILENRMRSFVCATALQKARAELQRQVFANISQDGEVFLMDMPTGSGKTLTSMKCALLRANLKQKKRIIYVIPYNSIIDQTVQTFEDLFGDSAQILRHQSSFSYEDKEDLDEDYRKSAIYVCENWDAKIIVTTAVQFFESIYANRRGKLRKLHNMAESILIFDEVHMMPREYLQPCLRAIAYITRYLNSEAIFLTATMPDFKKLLREYALKDTVICELIKDRTDFHHFKKNRYVDLCSISDDELLCTAAKHPSSLIVVNSRATARKLYGLCHGKKYHLSTYMTALDRTRVIGEIRQEIQNLNTDYPDMCHVPPARRVTVISTSLIEAGVDLDFAAAFRELNGLDNLLQTGGRCNREGKLKEGIVYTFVREEGKGTQRIEQNILKGILGEFDDISSNEAITAYYDRLFEARKSEITEKSLGSMCKRLDLIPFRSYSVQLIDSPTVSIVVERDETSRCLIKDIIAGRHTNFRLLQKYCCTVYPYELEALCKQGVVEECNEGMYILTNPDYYCPETGILLEGKDIFLEER